MSQMSARTLSSWLLALAVACAGCLASVLLWRQQYQVMAMVAQERFTHEAQVFAAALQRRLDSEADLLYGLRGLLILNPQLRRRDFERVASDMGLGRQHPEVKNVHFTRYVPGGERAAFEERSRADPHLDGRLPAGLAIHPPQERPDYYVVEFIWPLDGNESAQGLEIQSQPGNAEALLRSRDSRTLTMSAPFAFDLPDESGDHAGVIVRVPVFADDAGGAQRFVGAVGASLRAHDLVQALRAEGLGAHLALSLADVGTSDAPAPAQALIEAEAPGADDPALHDERLVRVGGRLWHLQSQPSASLLSPFEQRQPWLFVVVGLAGTALLAALVLALALRRAQAVHQMGVASDALRESEERFRSAFNQAGVGMTQTESETGRLLRVNQRMCAILGYTEKELLQMRVSDFSHPQDYQQERSQIQRMLAGEIAEFQLEKRYARKDGSQMWVELTVSPMRLNDGARYHIAVIQDITERKRVQQALQDNQQRLLDILDHMPVGVSQVRGSEFLFRNRVHYGICGFGPQDAPDVDTWWRLVLPDEAERERTRAPWQAACEEARRSGDASTIRPVECSLVNKAGFRCSIELSGMVLGDSYIAVMVDQTQRREAESEIRYLADNDLLTGLPNRRLLLDRLQQALAASARQSACGAVLMLDLDHFKTINETRGHDVGDRLLREAARRLRACLPSSATLARHGGDEFVAVLGQLGSTAQLAAERAEAVAHGMLAELRRPIAGRGSELLHTTLSIGITVFEGQGETVDELLKRCELAMYDAKAAGRDTLRFFDPRVQAAVAARAALEADMRTGIAGAQFELFYQPKMANGRISGAEALLRWRHPERGFVSPGQFIPLAEDSGLILPLGQWVLRNACERLAYWSAHAVLGELTLAVNVSPRQFHEDGFVAQVLAALAGSGADPRRLRLELTESMLLNDVDKTIAKMVELRGHGVRFSLDDFGTGYSSLSYLKRLPLHELKIDQSFVRDVLTDPNDAAIARTIIALGASLGLQVTAEGVETEEQRDFLARHGCQHWQGYLLSPPVPLRDYEALVLGRAGNSDEVGV